MKTLENNKTVDPRPEKLRPGQQLWDRGPCNFKKPTCFAKN